MLHRTNLIAMSFLAALLPAVQVGAQEQPAPVPRIGVYDARAVAVAWTASPAKAAEMKAKMDELKQAQAKGDSKRVGELKAWGNSQQERLHLQAFAAADVGDILERVEKELATLAEKSNVDAVVRKGAYVSPRSQVVDLTDEVVKLFGEPSERTKKIIEDLKTKPPLTREAVEQAEKKGGI